MRPTLFLSLALLSASVAAHADTFLLNISATAVGNDPAVNLVAVINGNPDPNVAGAYDITSGSGIWNQVPITLDPSGVTAGSFQDTKFSSPPFTYASEYEYDDVLYTSNSNGDVLDSYGLLFSAPDDHFNAFTLGTTNVYTDDESSNGFVAPLETLTVTQLPNAVTPEPASLLLLGTGLLGVTGVIRKRFV